MSDGPAPETPNSRPGAETGGSPPPPGAKPAVLAGADRYELIEEIARGGMGVVYRTWDRVLNREVGLKTLLKVPPPHSPLVARFREEAQITGQLQHPNVPPVHDLGTLPDGRPFLAMKLIKGETLAALLKKRPNPAAERERFVAIFEQIALGVAYAHAHNVIHRDLKPSNVMVGALGVVQVMDWGIAKVLPDDPRPAVDADELTLVRPDPRDGDETRSDAILGTPAYMAPEQARGAVAAVDRRSDVFSLGAILCTVLTGRPPYQGTATVPALAQAARAELGDVLSLIEKCGAALELIALCKRCLAVEPDHRPGDAGAVAQAVAAARATGEQRVREAELALARALAERRKWRRVQTELVAAVALVFFGGVVFIGWEDARAERRGLEHNAALGDQQLRSAKSAASLALPLLRHPDPGVQSAGHQLQRQAREQLVNLVLAPDPERKLGPHKSVLLRDISAAPEFAPFRAIEESVPALMLQPDEADAWKRFWSQLDDALRLRQERPR